MSRAKQSSEIMGSPVKEPGKPLDLGGGKKKQGWITIDMRPDADITHNLNDYPWPIKSNSQSRMRMSHILEHLDNPFKAMKECYRIAKDGCLLEIRVPWWKMDMFSWPVHKWHFKPVWFKRLTMSQKVLKGCGNPLSDFNYGGMDWRPVKEHTLRGSRRFWKKYQYTIWLKAVKDDGR